MKVQMSKFSTIVILGLLVVYMIPDLCYAQEFSRKGKYEFIGIFQARDKLEAEYSDINREAKIDGGPSGGFGIGYNFNDNLNINANFIFGSTDIEVEDFSGNLLAEADEDIFLWNVNLDYNLMTDSFTPLVTGGIGYIELDELDDTGFIWNLGAGFRWDVSEKWLIKILYKRTWTEIEDADDTSYFQSVGLSFGYKF